MRPFLSALASAALMVGAYAGGAIDQKRDALPLPAAQGARTSEWCEIVITKTSYVTGTTTVSVPSNSNFVHTSTRTIEVTSSVVVTVTAAPLPSTLSVVTVTSTET